MRDVLEPCNNFPGEGYTVGRQQEQPPLAQGFKVVVMNSPVSQHLADHQVRVQGGGHRLQMDGGALCTFVAGIPCGLWMIVERSCEKKNKNAHDFTIEDGKNLWEETQT